MNKEVKAISIEEFEATQKRVSHIWQRELVKAMEPGTAIQISHTGLKCRVDGAPGCSAVGLITRIRHSTGFNYRASHATNGDLLVARYPDSQPTDAP